MSEHLPVPRRIARLKSELLAVETDVCFERARIVTDAYRETAGSNPTAMGPDRQAESGPLHPALRRATATARVFAELPIFIRPGELLVGQRAARLGARSVYPEFHLDGLTEASTPPEIWSYWHGRTMGERVRASHPEALRTAEAELAAGYCTGAASGFGHMIVDYEKALQVGLLGIIREAETERAAARADGDEEGEAFLRSVITSLRGVIRWAERYAELAESLAHRTSRPGGEFVSESRRNELLDISRICRKVPAHPAETFHEALQSFWFVHLALHIEQYGWSISAGRFDQYMVPFIRSELASGSIDRYHSWELLLSLWVKFMENVGTKVKHTVFQNLTLGGSGADGEDESNELSHLCLDATAALRMIQPALTVRWHPRIEPAFWKRCHEVISLGTGMPALFNDDVIIPALVAQGVARHDAVGYGIVGCVEASIPGKEQGVTAGGHLNTAKALELALNDGRSMTTGARIGPRTGGAEAMQSFEALFDAYQAQVRSLASLNVLASILAGEEQKRNGYYPIESALLSDCIRRRRDLVWGSTRYNLPGVAIYGPTNTYDALHAIRRFVFDEKRLSLEDLRDALVADFRDGEALRLMLANHDERFGNDVSVVDELANQVNAVHARFFRDHTDGRGGRFTCGVWPVEGHVAAGTRTAAGADGRRSGAPLVDGVGACQGADRRGPTALLASVASLNHRDDWPAGNTFNVKFSPTTVAGDPGIRRMAALVEGFFRRGGQQIQINVVDAQTLRLAQQRPWEHEDLLVRVAGFSANFTTLSLSTQDEIISRTEQTALT